MKSCLTLMCGLVFGALAFLLFHGNVSSAKRFAGLDTQSASKLILSEEIKSVADYNKQNPDKVRRARWNSSDDAGLNKAAESAIQRSNEIAEMSGFMLNLKAGVFAVVGFVFGALAYMISCFSVVITTKPLDSLFDSAWGNLWRYLLTPFFMVAVLCALVWMLCAQILINLVLMPPELSYNALHGNTGNHYQEPKISRDTTPSMSQPDSDNEIQARVLAAQMARETEIGNTPSQTSNTEWEVKVPNGDTLNVRSGPGVNFPIVAKLDSNTKIQSSGEFQMNGATEWVKILLPGGEQVGWAVKGFLTKSQKANLPNKQSSQESRSLQNSNETKINFKCPNCAKTIKIQTARKIVDDSRSEAPGSSDYPVQVMRCPSCSSMIHIADESELLRPENQSPRTISGSDGYRYLRYPNGLLKVLY